MPVKKKTTPGGGGGKGTTGPKAARKPRQKGRASAPAGALPAAALKHAVTYFYLLAYLPAGKITVFRERTAPLRAALATSSGMAEADFFAAAIPEVCQRIVAFHAATRQPDPAQVQALAQAASQAEKSPQHAGAFQTEMEKVAGLPPRALPGNRLHRRKGCAFCRQPCRYGFFSLVSDPDFRELQSMYAVEAALPKTQQESLRPVLNFTFAHISQAGGTQNGIIQRLHLANLAYCLLLLSMAKSRLALPETALQAFQARSQAWILAG